MKLCGIIESVKRQGISTVFTNTIFVVGLSAAVLCSIPAVSEEPQSETSPLECDIGPINKTYGKTEWLVYGCSDQRTVVIVSAPGSPAMPFVFVFSPSESGYQLSGEGNGNKEATSAAYDELKMLTAQDIVALIEQIKRE